MRIERLRTLALCAGLGLAAAGACAPATAPVTAPTRRLPADSLALLERALQRARPAFATHAEALRAGVYGGDDSPAPVLARAPVGPSITLADPARPTAPSAAAAGAGEPTSFVVQIAAYSDLPSARQAAALAERSLGGMSARVDPAGAFFRVAVGGWPSAEEAEAELGRIRDVYPGAWVRRPGGR